MTGRILFISVIIILMALIISIRLYFVQIVDGEAFVSNAERQNINENTISYDRRDVYFESKDYDEIAQHLNSETVDKIKTLNLYGVTISTDKWRFYPGGALAANVIGF